MSKPSHASSAPCPAKPPRFSAGRGVGRGLVACLWLWTSTGPLAVAATTSHNQPKEAATSPYARAFGSFQRRDYERALGQLERLPDGLPDAQRADALNLRGAIYLRQQRFEDARKAFAEAARVDPGLWAAKYNEAEVSFRQKHYAASRTEFDALRDRTSRVFHPEEHRFLDYKVRLADLCAGREQPALDFVAEHRSEAQPPVAWYYLNAALEQRRGRPQKAEQWLAQADDKHPAIGGNAYAESFKRLGWPGDGEGSTGQTAFAANRRANRRATDGPVLAEAEKLPSKPAAERGASSSVESSSAQTSEPATVAVVQLMSNREAVAIPGDPVESASAIRANTPPAPTDRLSLANLPPAAPGWLNEAAAGLPRRELVPGLLAKPRRGRSTPAPTPNPAPSAAPSPSAPPSGGGGPASSPAASPAGPEASPAPTPAPSPAASPAAPASVDYTQKYEAAYVKFLEKDYPATLSLLDEADAIQPKQTQTATLRGQVFKQEYEAAYLAYRKADFTGALVLLDQADQAQPNYPDALNLRGLVYSKQRVYDRAETMFKKAMAVDPTLWAAKFNYAELPFNRGDYTTARSRFEDLLAETDAAKRPREAELTQYKVFLTLLLEGKTDQARSFMEHFNFSGATPAKYFCNAAMNFRAGTVDKANGWIDSAKKEYSPALVSIFLEPFYRLGWLADPTVPATTNAIAAASPGVEAATTPTVAPAASATPAPTATATPAIAVATPAASASPKLLTVAAATPTGTLPPVAGSPALLALASPAPASPGLSLQAGVSPTVTPSLVVAVTPKPTPVPTATLAPASPTPSATATPTAKPTATPTPSPSATPVLAAASVTPAPTPRVTPAPTATATATAATTATATLSATAEAAGTPAASVAAKKLTTDDLLRLGIAAAVLLYGVYVVYRLLTAASRRKARRLRAGDAAAKSDKVETSR